MAEVDRQDKLERLARLMQEIPDRVHSDVASEWPEPEYELTMTQFKALTYLQSGPRRMGDISRTLNISLSSVTNLVGRLESKGLVVRSHDSHDRRVVTCELTAEGRETVTRLWQVGRERLLHIASQLDDDELDLVLKAFETLVGAAIRLNRSAGDV